MSRWLLNHSVIGHLLVPLSASFSISHTAEKFVKHDNLLLETKNAIERIKKNDLKNVHWFLTCQNLQRIDLRIICFRMY